MAKIWNWNLGIGICLFLVSCFLIFTASVVGCGQVNPTSDTTTPSSTTTTTTVPTSITISGTLLSGAIESNSIGASRVAAKGAKLSDYTVVAVNGKTGRTYYAKTDANGSFSLLADNLDVGNVYGLSVVKPSNNFLGPVVIATKENSSDLIMGISATKDAAMGEIVVDETNSFAQPTSRPSSAYISDYLDVSSVSGLTIQTIKKPKGSDNYGKGSASLTTAPTREGADMDGDGIQGPLDTDEDGNGIINGIAGDPSCARVISNTVESVAMRSNIWGEQGSSSPAKDVAMITIVVTAKTGKLSEISSAKVINVPSSIKDVAVIRDSSSFGDPTSYPAEWTVWKNEDHTLYKSSSDNTWKVLLNPKGDMNAGDIFTIRVTYTGGSYQDFLLTNSYFMTDWPRIITCEGTALLTTEGTKTSPKTLSASGTMLTLTFTKPRDEDGNVIQGLMYSISYGTCEASGGSYGVTTAGSSETVTDVSAAPVLTHTINNITTNAPNQAYYVVPVAEANGQRNGTETWFIKP